MDYNDDRQVTFNRELNVSKLRMEKKKGLVSGLEESQDHEHQAVIYLDTIGMYKTRALFG